MTTVVAKIDSKSAISTLNAMINSDETLVLCAEGGGGNFPQLVVLNVEFGGEVKQTLRLYASGKWEMQAELEI